MMNLPLSSSRVLLSYDGIAWSRPTRPSVGSLPRLFSQKLRSHGLGDSSHVLTGGHHLDPLQVELAELLGDMAGQFLASLSHFPLIVRDWLLLVTHLQLVVIVVDPGQISDGVQVGNIPVRGGVLPYGIGLVENLANPD